MCCGGWHLGNDPLLPAAKTLSHLLPEVCSVLQFPGLNFSIARFVRIARTLSYLLWVLAATVISDPALNPPIIF